jgi:hypothetical protein
VRKRERRGLATAMRNYAEQLQKAYGLACGFFSEDILEEERKLAIDYDREKTNQAIILFNSQTGKLLKLPYFQRLKLEYARTVKRKVWGEIYPKLAYEHDFLFGTFDASTTKYYSQQDAHRKIQRLWNSLLTRIRKTFPWVRVIKSVEWQENGLGYHIHVLFVGVRFIDIEWIRDTWAKFEPNYHSVELKPFDDPKRALGYLLKYVTKSLRKDSYIPQSLVINWALHLRTLALSHSFSFPKSNSNGFWVFLGIMPLDLAESYTDQEILGYFGNG